MEDKEINTLKNEVNKNLLCILISTVFNVVLLVCLVMVIYNGITQKIDLKTFFMKTASIWIFVEIDRWLVKSAFKNLKDISNILGGQNEEETN